MNISDSMSFRHWCLTTLALCVFILASQHVRADTFDDPKNLKVLPSDITPDELRRTMVGFSAALNARCSYCHMVDDALSMPDPDYSADDKWTMQVAREMLQMVDVINGRVSNLDFSPRQQKVEVQCMTCHRGQNRPILILQVLNEARENGGIDAVIAKYSELRERYYGNHTFDLRPSTLAGFARKVASEGDTDGSIKILDFANENFPDQERVLFALARVHQQRNENDQAIAFLRELVRLLPDSSFYAEQLGLAEKAHAE